MMLVCWDVHIILSLWIREVVTYYYYKMKINTLCGCFSTSTVGWWTLWMYNTNKTHLKFGVLYLIGAITQTPWTKRTALVCIYGSVGLLHNQPPNTGTVKWWELIWRLRFCWIASQHKTILCTVGDNQTLHFTNSFLAQEILSEIIEMEHKC